MFSGKSLELVDRLQDAELQGLNVRGIKPAVAGEPARILSLAGPSFPATKIDRADSLPLVAEGCQVVGIDEAQFFDDGLIEAVRAVRDMGGRVLVAGLDLDFRGDPFSPMPQLQAIADSTTRLTATCEKCGSTATHSQRLINGGPARRDAPLVLVGGRGLYEARCEACFESAD